MGGVGGLGQRGQLLTLGFPQSTGHPTARALLDPKSAKTFDTISLLELRVFHTSTVALTTAQSSLVTGASPSGMSEISPKYADLLGLANAEFTVGLLRSTEY
jgi:hypothetical protein